MSNKSKDEIIDSVADWMDEVGARGQTPKTEADRVYVEVGGKKIYMPQTLTELTKTL
jgi:hypothetical protein